MTRLLSGRRQTLVSAKLPFYVLVGWNKVHEQQKEDGKAKLKISVCIHHFKMMWESTEKQLHSSGKNFQDFRHCLFFKISLKMWRRTSHQRTSRTGSSSCQCSTTFWWKQLMRIASLTLRKSRVTRRNSYQDIGLFCGSRIRKRDGMATLTINKDSGTAPPTKWYSNSKKLVIQSSQVPVLWVVESWSREEVRVPFTSLEILWIRNNFSNSSFLESDQCPCGSHGLVLSIRFDKWRKRITIPVDNGIWTMVKPAEVELLVFPPNLALGNKMQGGASFRQLDKRYRWHKYVKKKPYLQHLVTTWNCYKIRPDDDDGLTIFEFSSLSENSSFGSYSCRYRLLDQSLKFMLWKFYTSMD